MIKREYDVEQSGWAFERVGARLEEWGALYRVIRQKPTYRYWGGLSTASMLRLWRCKVAGKADVKVTFLGEVTP
jgi:hypothetical protein